MAGPSTFEVIDRISQSSGGVYETLDEARGCVAYDRLEDWEIWQGDHIVEESEGPKAKMTTARVHEIVAEIDRLNARVCDLVREIREGGHPEAEAFAEALDEEPCVVLACAGDVIVGVLNPEG